MTIFPPCVLALVLANLAVNEFLVSGTKSLAVQRSMMLQRETRISPIFRSGIDNIAQSRLPADIK
jgi:hypothetical protein